MDSTLKTREELPPRRAMSKEEFLKWAKAQTTWATWIVPGIRLAVAGIRRHDAKAAEMYETVIEAQQEVHRRQGALAQYLHERLKG